ncbi:MAG: hypothetical protein LBI12_00860 [Treponema sp.]|jgi:hypothetical protein|nr:hypothetical protein [Treponema sp.]
MKTQKTDSQVFLVLVPHRDTRLVMRNYSCDLFKAGFAGAYSFPWVAPLAALSHPFNKDELKLFAGFLRKATGKDKISAEKIAVTAFPDKTNKYYIFGPCLNIKITAGMFADNGINENTSKKIYCLSSPPVIGALLSENRKEKLPPLEVFSFRAAAIANMYWTSCKNETAHCASFNKWKIGGLVWLPATGKTGRKK